MIGSYVAVSAALAFMKGLETTSHNLGNASTPGFKKTMLQMDPVPVESPASVSGAVHLPAFARLGESVLDLSAGSMDATGHSLDLALEGEGNFVVRSPQGPVLTRNGSFRVATDGTLVSAEGFPVLGRDGREIVLAGHGDPEVRPNGEILMDGTSVGRIDVQTAPGQSLAPEDCRILQGHLEKANVNPIEEMIKMIELSRGFGMHMKCIDGFSQLNEKLVNTLGRV